MKSFIVLSAVLCSVVAIASASGSEDESARKQLKQEDESVKQKLEQEDNSVNKKLKACAKECRWTKDIFKGTCDKGIPIGMGAICLMRLNSCIWEAAGVVKPTSPEVTVDANAAKYIVLPDDADLTIGIIEKCGIEVTKSLSAAAWDIYKCYREKPEVFVRNCHHIADVVYG